MSRRVRSDDGSMLVELLVGMVLTGIVSMIVLDAIVGGFTTQRDLQHRGDALAQIRTAAQRVTREIREYDVRSATASSLTVKVSDTVTKTWTLTTSGSATSLVSATTTNGVASAAVTVISSLDGTTLPFSYGPRNQWTAPAGSTVNASTCAVAGTSPGSYSYHCIGEVTLHLVRTIPGHTSVTVNATVDLRNAE